jgi:hypothetical protein
MVPLQWRKILLSSLLLAFLNVHLCAASSQDGQPPSSTAIMVDVPVRILGIGLTVISGAFFVLASPFALISGSFEDTWDALVIEPLEFTFIRPMGKFDDWKIPSTSETTALDLKK